MTTEMILLLAVFVFILFGAFKGENGPAATFSRATPKLGARIERHLETGSGFRIPNDRIRWEEPR